MFQIKKTVKGSKGVFLEGKYNTKEDAFEKLAKSQNLGWDEINNHFFMVLPNNGMLITYTIEEVNENNIEYELAASETEREKLLYQMAWIRSRKYDIQNQLDIINEFFKNVFIFNVKNTKKSLVLTMQKSLFELESEELKTEKVIMKESDFSLVSLMLTQYNLFLEAGYPPSKASTRFDTANSMEILIKGFCVLCSEKIVKPSYFEKHNIQNSELVLKALSNLLNSLLTKEITNPSKTAIKNTLKAINNYEVLVKEIEAKKELLKIEEKNEVKTTKEIEAKVAAEKSKKLKPVSSWSKKDLAKAFLDIKDGKSEFDQDIQLKVVSHIAKNSDRIQEFVQRNAYKFFIEYCFNNNIPMEFSLRNSLFIEYKETIAKAVDLNLSKNIYEKYMTTYFLDQDKFDWNELAVGFLNAYKKHSQEKVNQMLRKNKEVVSLRMISTHNVPFLFDLEDLDIIRFLVVVKSENVNQEKILIYNGKATMVNSKMKTKILSNGKELTLPENQLRLFSDTDGLIIPNNSGSWNTFSAFYQFTLSIFLTKEEHLNLSEEEFELAKHLLSTVQLYECSDSYESSIYKYKVMNFVGTKSEVMKFISKAYESINNSSFHSKDHKKVFFNKKLSKHLLTTISGFYSSLSVSDKSFIFLKIEEGTLVKWLETIDPLLLSMTELLNGSLADNVILLLEEMNHLQPDSSIYRIRQNPIY